MTNTKLATLFLILTLASLPIIAQSAQDDHATAYTPVTKYEPKRDAAKDIADAVREADRTHRHVLVEVGGEWCSWCHTLDKFFAANPDLTALRDKNFVTVKVNYSEENFNQPVLSKYPSIEGYPHIFFLDSKGKLLKSQDTGELENGHSYNLEKLKTALTTWAPK
jgi:thioredoxin-related protein